MTKRITSQHCTPLLFTPALPGDGLIGAEIAAFDKFWHCRFVTPCTQAIGVGAPPISGFRESLPDAFYGGAGPDMPPLGQPPVDIS
ncbi:MAG: hypothetical protein WCC90_02735 [Methylocella sp.]